ncbi:lipid-A-disaccharide synthase [Fulvivirga sp. M361]|uniref:lipid-A-disaccharide synthase n=1 Tax=Fulvivirga sp. M361 TaxID=2594266 RepID=UPI00117B4DA7|nr:lipid-A-disaccharide synthase [Fulvivirga sp. M361]TRX62199.1 lipid-A-disaccharide synthase [Fulvivirga sp. M361]
MRYYLIAGERSGDLHGGNLVRSLKKKDPEAEFRGFGGDAMESEGMHLSVHYRDLAFMGFWEVFKNLGTISGYLKRCRADIVQFQPDVVILIDYAGFNLKIAGFCKKQNIRVFYYISPKVWAWNTKRALKLKRLVDRMFVILPFEKEFYKNYGWEVDYVGNPVLDALKNHVSQRADFDEQKTVALLPGSRKQELEYAVPLFVGLADRFPGYEFVVAAVDNIEKSLYASLDEKQNVTLLYGETYDLLARAKAAVVTSGTAALETALWKTPQVVTYRTSKVTYWIAKSLIKVDYISLVNLIAGKMVVKELIQEDFNLEKLSEELMLLMDDEGYRARMLREYDDIYNLLDQGSASENAADKMVNYLNL